MLCVGVELGRSRCVGRERDGVAPAVVNADWAEVTGRRGGRCDMQVGMAAECCCWSIQQPRNDRTGVLSRASESLSDLMYSFLCHGFSHRILFCPAQC